MTIGTNNYLDSLEVGHLILRVRVSSFVKLIGDQFRVQCTLIGWMQLQEDIKERINGNADDDSGRRRKISGKRHREEGDDKWVHDLYEPHELQDQASDQRVGTKDLRLKLQRRSIQQATQIIKGSLSGGTRDLREKLSGTVYSQTVKTDAPKTKLNAIPEESQPAKRSVKAEAPALDTKNVARKVLKKKSQRKANFIFQILPAIHVWARTTCIETALSFIPCLIQVESVDSFLQALGLEKYAITFQAEEVDMAALVHMTDVDLKAMGIPMGILGIRGGARVARFLRAPQSKKS
ncbi:hypothetical protein HAX54_051015 [Datura stramonium]|uniref:SAM domain-containing protein n=1 Tax=Datura stramonium TaxID=4076 RepID=A0ABS8RR37_DATST|nr:hypothetical protein [Datura stramonium]